MNYSINTERILTTQLGEEGVVYDIEKNEYFSLNETSFAVLKGVEEGKSTDEIISQLLATYDVPENTCREQVLGIIEDFKIRQMIQ